MKTILIIASFSPSLINFRGKLIEALQTNNMKVHVVAPGLADNRHIKAQLEYNNVIPHNLTLSRNGFNPILDLITFFQLIKIMKKLHPQYVLAYTIKPVIYGMLAAKLSRIPKRFALITGLGYAFTGKAEGIRGLLRKLLQKMYQLALQYSKKIFFQNPDDKALFDSLKIIGKSNQALVINGSGVDLDYYSVVPPPEDISFLMISRLLGDKGVREYVEAAKQVQKKYPNVNYSIVGWIDENPNTIGQRELDEWITEGTISFLGELEDVRPAIAAASVYVLPSYREGTPRTVLESMAMGRPIITTDAPGCRETVENGRNGFLVPVKDSTTLEEAMEKFIKYPELIEKMGKESRKIAEEKYNVHKVNKVIMDEMGLS
jgi:glycosyltransferase involved in cell wall biosynthesis